MAEPEVITEELPQEQEVSVELDTPVTPEKVETKAPAEDSELVKRLKETARAEGIQEEARRQAALKVEEDKKFAAERTTWHQEQANLQARALQADMDSLTNALGAAQAERAAAITDLKRARAEGDTDAELEADERRINAVSSIRELEKTKLDYEAYIEEQNRAPQQQRPAQQPAQQQPADPVERAIVGLAPSAQAWFRQHPEYVTDARKNAKVKSLHFDALEAGHELLSPAYFEYVESHLGLRGHTNGQNGQQRVSGMTSVTREAPGMAPMNSGDGKVRLTLEEQAIAKAAKNSPNESDADAFKRYAKFKLELRQKKANGEVQ